MTFHPIADIDLEVAVSNCRSSVTGRDDLASPRRVLLASLEYTHGFSRLSEAERYGRSANPEPITTTSNSRPIADSLFDIRFLLRDVSGD
jgi:hypothetical protein